MNTQVDSACSRKPYGVHMPSFWNIFNKTEELKQVDATVPLGGGYNQTEDPPDNYYNFAREGYGKNAIVYACIRELSTAAASVRYLVQQPTREGGFIEDLSLIHIS